MQQKKKNFKRGKFVLRDIPEKGSPVGVNLATWPDIFPFGFPLFNHIMEIYIILHHLLDAGI